MESMQDPSKPEDSEPARAQQDEEQSNTEGHAGQGSESALKQLRVWEQRRASNSVGKRRQGPG